NDRDEVKIKLFDLFKQARKPDRRIIDILITLMNKLPAETIKEHKIEEQEFIVNYVDPVLSSMLHDPGDNKLFF
ncbi:uncharacterized protein EV154DRAFT_409865, partial [Mucor mucedo]|uniref:uncharacterized protein n=1 Tax=Mucor mucedo TaxID=29922 RepID=UPI0022206485